MSLKAKIVVKRNLIIVRLDGEIDQHTIKNFKLKLFEVILKYKKYNILLNMEKLSFMDSTGIGLLLSIYNKIKNKGQIYLTKLSKNVEKIILLTGAYKICDIVNSEEEVVFLMEEIA